MLGEKISIYIYICVNYNIYLVITALTLSINLKYLISKLLLPHS